MAYKKPRGKCPYCGKRKALTKDGRMHKHRLPRLTGDAPAESLMVRQWCGGSGHPASG
jgi:hypothetical protein